MTTRADVQLCSECEERIEPQDPVTCAECAENLVGPHRAALEAVLLFYSEPPWDAVKRERWQEITGHDEATTKILCDHIREVLAEECEEP